MTHMNQVNSPKMCKTMYICRNHQHHRCVWRLQQSIGVPHLRPNLCQNSTSLAPLFQFVCFLGI